MKAVAGLLLLLAAAVLAGTIEPAMLSITNVRSEAVAALTNVTFYKGEALLFTNCLARGAGSTVTQDLGGLQVEVTLGDATRAFTVTGTVVGAGTAGEWWALSAVPALPARECTIQVRLTDGTNTYTYPHKTIPVKAALD